MPYISTKTTCSITVEEEKRLKRKFGQAIELLPGKTEAYLMLSFSGNEHLWLGGSDAPAALINVEVLGGLQHDACEALTARLTEIMEQVLNIQPDRVYVKYFATNEWGWNGHQF